MTQRLFIIVFLLFCVTINQILAQDTTLLSTFNKMSLEELMEIEITSVSKKSESMLKAPQNVIVIKSEELRRRGYTDLEQVFHDLPGFDISRGYGTEYSQIYQRGYRSKNTDRTLVLVDGVEENDLWSNSAWVSRQHALSNIDRIEVIYGPSSTMYGANAFAGVVNIITKKNTEMLDNKSLAIHGQAGGGSWNTYFADVTMAAQHKDASFQLTGRIYRSDEMDISSYSNWDYDLDAYNSDYYAEILGTNDADLIAEAMNLDRQYYYNDSILGGVEPQYGNKTRDWYLNGKFDFKGFTLGFQSYQISEGYGAWYRDDYVLGTRHSGSWGPNNSHIYARYEGEISEKLTFSSFTRFKVHRLAGDNNNELYYYGYMNGGLGINDLLQNPDTTITYNNQTGQLDTAITTPEKSPYWSQAFYHTYSQQLRTEFKFVYRPIDELNIVGGAEYRQSHIQGQYIVSAMPNPEEIANPEMIDGGNHFYSTDFGLFLQADYTPFKDLSIVLGGRLDQNSIRVEGGYGTVFNPKVAAVFSPGDFIFKGIYSEAFKDAAFWTKYGTTPGRLLNNPNLEPEKVKNLEFSAIWQVTPDLYFDLTAYNAMYSDVIGTAQVQYVDTDGDTIQTTQHQAMGSLDIKGITSRLNYKFRNLTFYTNYTYTLPYNTTESGNVRIGDIAGHQINAGANAMFFEKLNINLRGNWVGEKPTGSETTITTNPLNKINPYLVLNGAVSYNLYQGVMIQLAANNIFDTEYFHPGVRSADGDYYAAKIPQFERHFFLKLYIDF